jgi:hypothetical protein
MFARAQADCCAEQQHKEHRPEESSHPSTSPGREFNRPKVPKSLKLLKCYSSSSDSCIPANSLGLASALHTLCPRYSISPKVKTTSVNCE